MPLCKINSLVTYLILYNYYKSSNILLIILIYIFLKILQSKSKQNNHSQQSLSPSFVHSPHLTQFSTARIGYFIVSYLLLKTNDE